MDDDAKLELMQKRIIKSYAWQRDIIVPLSKDFDCTVDEVEEIFFDLFDMSSLEALHATWESAKDICLALSQIELCCKRNACFFHRNTKQNSGNAVAFTTIMLGISATTACVSGNVADFW